MTALDGIDRFETPALWRADASAQRREVYVAIGEAELVVQDKAGTALSHWSLPALVRLNPGKLPAHFAPGKGADEELEIEDAEMVAALDRVVAAVEKGRARPGRLRRVVTGLGLGLGLGFAVMWLPGALRDQAAGLMPAAKEADIGARMLAELTLLTGPPCAGPSGREAADRLRARILPTTPARIEVLRDLPMPALALPGGLLVLSDSVLVTQDDPDVAAGHVLAAATGAAVRPPLVAFLRDLGALDLVRLLTAGTVTGAQVTDHVESLLLTPPPAPGPAALRPAFTAVGLAWGPYATTRGLPDGPETPSAFAPALDDSTWQVLREISDS